MELAWSWELELGPWSWLGVVLDLGVGLVLGVGLELGVGLDLGVVSDVLKGGWGHLQYLELGVGAWSLELAWSKLSWELGGGAGSLEGELGAAGNPSGGGGGGAPGFPWGLLPGLPAWTLCRRAVLSEGPSRAIF